MGQTDPNGFRGPLLLISGMFCFALMDSLTVFLLKEISFVQLLTIRYWLFLVLDPSDPWPQGYRVTDTWPHRPI